MAGKRGHGTVTKLPSGRYRARYLHHGKRWTAPSTFERKASAEMWLAAERRLVESGEWTPPPLRAEQAALAAAAPVLTLDTYARTWMQQRDLRERTRDHYAYLWDKHLAPILGAVPVGDLTPVMVRGWHASACPGKDTTRAHAYGLLRTICKDAVLDGIMAVNPCHIRGAGAVKRKHHISVLSASDLARLTQEMPPRLRCLITLAAWCGLRQGELLELRRGDIDLERGVIAIRRGVANAKSGSVVGKTKTEAGARDIVIPPHIIGAIADHLDAFTRPGKSALLFPAVNDPTKNMRPSTLYVPHYYNARAAIGRPDLRLHDLRHTGATLAAQAGATLPELMERLGHSTPSAAMRYQHVAHGRSAEVAARMSALWGAPDTPEDEGEAGTPAAV